MNHRQKLAGEKSNAVSKFFVYLLMAVLTAVIVVPVAWVFMASVKQNSEFYGNPFALPEGLYLQNFADAWTKARMGDYFFTSIMITAVALCILLVVALPAAYVLSRYKFKGSKLLNTCFMAGLFINVSYIVVPIFLMFVSGDKLVKRLFGHSVFLNNPFIVALVLAATTLPFTIYLLSSYLSTLPKDYEEAAYVDGAGMFKRFWYITLPGISSVLGISTLLSTIWTFNDFENVFLITGGGPIYSSSVISTYTYDLAFIQNSFGRALSVAVSVIPLMLILILVSQKVINGDRNE